MQDKPNQRPFVSEDQSSTFESWLDLQGIAAGNLTADQRAMWGGIYNDVMKRATMRKPLGLMKLGSMPDGEHRYAVAVPYDTNLFLALLIRRSSKGDCYVIIPRDPESGDPHTSYHRDGTYHHKTFNAKMMSEKRQPLNAAFKGVEGLGTFSGHGPKKVGAICNPVHLTAVMEIPQGVLGPRNGHVSAELIEPGFDIHQIQRFGEVVGQKIFKDTTPWLVVTVERT